MTRPLASPEAALSSVTVNPLPAHDGAQALTTERRLEFVPRLDWTTPHETEHVVQFYENEPFLLRTLSEYIGIGLATGAACIVVATKEHRAGLDERLQGAGLDLAGLSASGQYIALDAAETLAQLMQGGAPSQDRFTAIVGGMIEKAGAGRSAVRVFGEMVGLLWADGQYDAALELEALWNALQETYRFALLCAYPIHRYGGDVLAQPLGDICNAHARVIPAESYTTLTDADDRPRAIVQLQQKARALEAEIAERKAAEAALRTVKDELELQVADLRRLHEMSARITSTLDIESVLREVLQAALTVQGADLGLLSLCDPEREGLKLQISRGFDDACVAQLAWVPPGGGACGTCYARRERVMVEDVEADPMFLGYRHIARAARFRSVHSTPLMARSGAIIGVLSVHYRQPHRPTERETHLMDLYAQMAADAIENARLYQDARDAIQVRDHFLSIAAHELKTPLTSLLGTVQLLQRRSQRDGTATESGSKALRVIIAQAKRLNKMIMALLDVSRIQTGRLTIDRAPVDLCALTRRVVEELQPTLENHSVDCQISSAPLIIQGDEVRLEQVIQNLLSNAVKYTPCGGPILVRVERQADLARLMVADQGIGIPLSDQAQLFQRFYRASNADTQYMSGMGIGLYVVKEIVTLHDGAIAVESREGAGSTFTVTLPLSLACIA